MTTIETGLANGVSFALSDEQRELRALAREFAEKEIRPKSAEYDEHSTHPADVIAKAHEVGLMNLHVPESLGGIALPSFDEPRDTAPVRATERVAERLAGLGVLGHERRLVPDDLRD